jgi:hypothetical protein
MHSLTSFFWFIIYSVRSDLSYDLVITVSSLFQGCSLILFVISHRGLISVFYLSSQLSVEIWAITYCTVFSWKLLRTSLQLTLIKRNC